MQTARTMALDHPPWFRLKTAQERAADAAAALMMFFSFPRRCRVRVYGVFDGDLMVSWSVSRLGATRNADKEQNSVRVQYIGEVKP